MRTATVLNLIDRACGNSQLHWLLTSGRAHPVLGYNTKWNKKSTVGWRIRLKTTIWRIPSKHLIHSFLRFTTIAHSTLPGEYNDSNRMKSTVICMLILRTPCARNHTYISIFNQRSNETPRLYCSWLIHSVIHVCGNPLHAYKQVTDYRFGRLRTAQQTEHAP